MTENEIFAEVQALHDAIKANYRVEQNCVLVDPKGADKGRMTGLQITLGQLFPHTKEGRELRLDTLVAVLPLLQPGGKPIDLDSTNRLWLAELLALRDWLENGQGLGVLEIIKQDHREWAVRLRDALGYVERPIVLRKEKDHASAESEMAYWQAGTAHNGQSLQGALPF